MRMGRFKWRQLKRKNEKTPYLADKNAAAIDLRWVTSAATVIVVIYLRRQQLYLIGEGSKLEMQEPYMQSNRPW